MMKSTRDPAGPIRRDEQRVKVLQEMNQFGEAQEQIIREVVPKINVL